MASDTEIIKAVGNILVAHCPVDWNVEQNYQSAGQFANDTPTIYFAKLGGDAFIGSPKRTAVWDAATGTYSNQTLQMVQSTVRVQGFANTDDPDAELTPADVASLAAMALATDDALAALKQIGAQPLRIRQLPAVPMEDERGQWAVPATFDFLLTHRRVMVRALRSAAMGELFTYPV